MPGSENHHQTLLDNLRPSPAIEELWAGTTTPEDDEALEENIKQVGPIYSILADERGDIIDGHRCWRAYKKLGIKHCFVTVVKIKSEDKLELAVRLNANRRHLTMDQKKEIVRKLLRGNPAYSANDLGRIVGMDKNTAQRVKDEMIEAEEIDKVAVVGRDGKKYPIKGGATGPLKDSKRIMKELAQVKALPGVVTAKRVRSQIAKEKREKAAKKGARLSDPAGFKLLHCDFRNLPNEVPEIERRAALVIADQPYEHAFLPSMKDVAEMAKQMLMPGGWLIDYTGTNNLDQVMAYLSAQLRYVWTFCLPFKVGGSFASYGLQGEYGSLRVFQLWRPVLLYHNGTPEEVRSEVKVADRRPARGPQKDWHPHQQCIEDMEHFIRKFTKPNDLVVDFFGGGFTGAAAVKSVGGGRSYVGCDIVLERVLAGRARLDETPGPGRTKC
jgi:ParB-like chromosome segregation protein Spo0J